MHGYDVRSDQVVLAFLGNGGLRAVRKDEDGTRLGLPLLGDAIMHYVVFKRRSTAGRTNWPSLWLNHRGRAASKEG